MNKFKYIALFVVCNSIAISSWAKTATCEYGFDGNSSAEMTCCSGENGGAASWLPKKCPSGRTESDKCSDPKYIEAGAYPGVDQCGLGDFH